jgi:hypothetical protein
MCYNSFNLLTREGRRELRAAEGSEGVYGGGGASERERGVC